MSDLISRQAAIDALEREQSLVERPITETRWFDLGLRKAQDVLSELPSAQPGQQWIPVKMRPMDSEEREYWECLCGYELKNEDAVMFDCPMPEDGQEILVSYGEWISMDKCEINCGYCGLEGNGDWDGIIAWMPLPKPYEEGKHDCAS